MGQICNSACFDIHKDKEESDIIFVDNKAQMRDIRTNKTYEISRRGLNKNNVNRINSPVIPKKKSIKKNKKSTQKGVSRKLN